MKRTKLYLGMLFLACLGMGACIEHIPVKIYTRPEIGLPPEIRTLGVLDRSQPPMDSSALENQVVKLSGNVSSMENSYLSFATNLSFTKLAEIYPDSSFSLKNLPFQIRRNAADTFPEPISRALIQSLCQQHRLDGMLTIELFQPRFITRSKTNLSNTVKMKAELEVGWRIYLANGEVLMTDLFVQEREWIGEQVLDPPQGERQKKAYQDAIILIAQDAAQTLYQILRPIYTVVERDVYLRKRGPNDAVAADMEKAGNLARKGNWEAAMSLWRPIASQKGYGKTAGMAAHNMAVGCEHLGEVPLALSWIKVATQTHNLLLSQPYQLILEYRTEALP